MKGAGFIIGEGSQPPPTPARGRRALPLPRLCLLMDQFKDSREAELGDGPRRTEAKNAKEEMEREPTERRKCK